jgi:deoxycytidylate deaminase
MKEPTIERKTNKGADILFITRSGDTPLGKIDLTNYILFDRKEDKDKTKEIYIKQPYLSKKFTVSYIEDKDNEFFQYGKELWSTADKSKGQFTVTLYEKNNSIVAFSVQDGYLFHLKNGCERVRRKIPTGQGYDLCDGCKQINHSEPSALRKAKKYKKYAQLKKANAYLYGHWWSCDYCSTEMEKAGIKHLFLSKEWTKAFLDF